MDKFEAAEQFGRRVAVLRTAQGWSVTDLAYVAGLCRQVVSRIEHGATAREDTRHCLRVALGWNEDKEKALELLGV